MARRVRAGAGAYVKTNPSSIRRREVTNGLLLVGACARRALESGRGARAARLWAAATRRRVASRRLGRESPARHAWHCTETGTRCRTAHSEPTNSKEIHCGGEWSPVGPTVARTVVTLARRGPVGSQSRHAKQIGAREQPPSKQRGCRCAPCHRSGLRSRHQLARATGARHACARI